MLKLPLTVSLIILVAGIATALYTVNFVLASAFPAAGEGWFVQPENQSLEPLTTLIMNVGLFGIILVALFRAKFAAIGLAIMSQATNLMDLIVVSTGRDSGIGLLGLDIPLNFILRPLAVIFVLAYTFGASRMWLVAGAIGILISYPLTLFMM